MPAAAISTLYMPGRLVLRIIAGISLFVLVTTDEDKSATACRALGPVRSPHHAKRLPYLGNEAAPLPGEPLVLRGAASTWPAAGWTLSELAKRFVGERVFLINFWCWKDPSQWEEEAEVQGPESDCQEIESGAAEFFEALASMQLRAGNASEAHRLGLRVPMLRADPTLFTRRPELMQDLWPGEVLPPELLARGYQLWPSFWAGPQGAQTGVHADTDPGTLLAHFGPGRKAVALLPAEAAAVLGAQTAAEDGAFYATPGLDLFAPDLFEHFPGAGELCGHPRLVHATLEQGDILYVPCGWFHQVQYLEEPSVSVSISILAPHEHARGKDLVGCMAHLSSGMHHISEDIEV